MLKRCLWEQKKEKFYELMGSIRYGSHGLVSVGEGAVTGRDTVELVFCIIFFLAKVIKVLCLASLLTTYLYDLSFSM